MDEDYEDERLRRLAEDASETLGFDGAIVKAYRKRVQFIKAAADERDFYAMKSYRFEKLKGDLDGLHSIRLNDQWRLLIRLEQHPGGKRVLIVKIADYH